MKSNQTRSNKQLFLCKVSKNLQKTNYSYENNQQTFKKLSIRMKSKLAQTFNNPTILIKNNQKHLKNNYSHEK